MSPKVAQRVFLLALVAWVTAWILPSHQWRERETAFGWQCFLITAPLVSDLIKAEEGEGVRPLDWLQALSPWTNLLVPLAVFLLLRGRPPALVRALPLLLLAAWLLDMIWLYPDDDHFGPAHLRVGYYLWMASFFALSLSARALLRSGGETVEQSATAAEKPR